MKNRPRIFVHPGRCVGCHNCELACAVAHSRTGTLPDAIRETPMPQRRIFVAGNQATKGPVHCRHCDEAPCVRVCPTGALFRNDAKERVQYNQERCISCHLCTLICPFGVLRPTRADRHIIKCDGCPGRDVPACVSACLTGALRFQTEQDYERQRRQQWARFWWQLHPG